MPAEPFTKFVAYVNAGSFKTLPATLLLWNADDSFMASVDMTGDALWEDAILDVGTIMRIRAIKTTIAKTNAGAVAMFVPGIALQVRGPKPIPLEVVIAIYESRDGTRKLQVYPTERINGNLWLGKFITMRTAQNTAFKLFD
jgi:hypothetical protein